MYEAKGILLCQSLITHTHLGVSQGQEEGEGPLGHTRRFGQFWMVRVNDPPQSGTWEIQVTAKGTPRVRVQGKKDDIALWSPHPFPRNIILLTLHSHPGGTLGCDLDLPGS